MSNFHVEFPLTADLDGSLASIKKLAEHGRDTTHTVYISLCILKSFEIHLNEKSSSCLLCRYLSVFLK